MLEIRVAVLSKAISGAHGLVALLESDPDFLAPAAKATDSVNDICLDDRPDVVLIDAGRFSENLPVVVQELAQRTPHTRIILVGVDENKPWIMDSMAAGAIAYVSEPVSVTELKRAITAVLAGDAVCSKHFAYLSFRRLERLSAYDASAWLLATELSLREFSVFELLSHGLTNHEIALVLKVSVHTVKNHVHHILRKLNFHGRVEVIAMFRERAASVARRVGMEIDPF